MIDLAATLILVGGIYFCIRAGWVIGQMIHQQWDPDDPS